MNDHANQQKKQAKQMADREHAAEREADRNPTGFTTHEAARACLNTLGFPVDVIDFVLHCWTTKSTAIIYWAEDDTNHNDTGTKIYVQGKSPAGALKMIRDDERQEHGG